MDMSMNKTNKFINDSNIILPKVKIHLCGNELIEDWSCASPVRSHWRFYWNPKPGAEVSDKNKIYYLDKSVILVIPPGVRVSQIVIKPCESLYVHASFDLAINDTADHIFTVEVSPSLKENIKRLSETFNQFIIGEFIFAIISRLPPNIWRQQINDSRIEKVCRLLKKQPERAWKNQELAVKACFSENAFIRRFREVTGFPPQLFLQKLRLERTAVLLLKNELSIEEIAAVCGFCDRHYLTKMFKKHFGQSPGRFRISANTP
jgi:AraC-like DNA-binding protein